ncbi:MAG TPA: Rrf2 family transcriptional regulator [Candidatus Solibacter sp.]|nr:Rrf2 family transcriptional regulator [Candidatus Solibacter sp.]
MSNSLLSKPCSYAIRAMTLLADQPPGRFSSAREICDQERIPQAFLGKVFLPLCRCRLLTSLRGIGGGYALAVPPEQIRLLAIVQAIDGAQLNQCILEDHPCGDPCNCLLHPAWAAAREQFVDFLKQTTLADLAQSRKPSGDPTADRYHSPEEIPPEKLGER